MVQSDQNREIEDNFDFFNRNLKKYLPNHKNQYALLKDKKLIAFYDSIADAYYAGYKKYGNQPFSLQHVTEEPAHLGLWSDAII